MLRDCATAFVSSLLFLFLCFAVRAEPGGAPIDNKDVDTALIVSVDVSGSVSASRYQLQMQGIAKALEDPAVIAAISTGPNAGIYFTMIAWADKPKIVVHWRRIVSKRDAAEVADIVRHLPPQGGEFTCFGRMFDAVANEVIPALPARATRIMVDVSGDGVDNCTDLENLHVLRQGVLKLKATINGLPILVRGENDFVGAGAFRAPGYGLRELSRDPDHDVTTLPRWYSDHVVGGPGSFVLPAKGYGDFANALRRKFIMEISMRPPRQHVSQR